MQKFLINIRFAWRNITKHRASSVINIAGLAIAITCCLLILQYVLNELSYDDYHKDVDRKYRVATDIYRDGKLNLRSATAYAALGPTLKNEFPEVDQYVRIFHVESQVAVGEKKFREEKTYYSDSGLFNFFSYPLLRGQTSNALKEPYSIAISEEEAKKYFGSVDCIGQRMELNNFFKNAAYTVTAVFRVPENSHFKPDLLVSFTTFSSQPGYIPDWGWRDFYTYISLKDKADEKGFAQKISATDYVGNHADAFKQRNIRHQLFLQPVTSIHLYSNLNLEFGPNGNATTVYALLLISILILIIAWVNCVNLTTAQSLSRSKEVGVKKTIGARKVNLILQFLTESALINFMAFGIAALLTWITEPFFYSFLQEPIPISIWHNPLLLLGIFLVFLLGIFLSGLYPSFVLSSYSPSIAIREKGRTTKSKSHFRQSLIVFQFCISTLLIICTITIYQQVNYMRNQNTGMNMMQTVVIQAPVPADSNVFRHYLEFKNLISENARIKSVTASHIVPGDEIPWTNGIRKLNADNTSGSGLVAFLNAVEPNFIPDYELQMIAGRNFIGNYPTDNRSMILSETALSKLGYSSPQEALNEKILVLNDTFTVVGVVSDYHQFGMQRAAEPYIFLEKPDELRRYSVKIASTNIPETLRYLKQAYEQSFPSGVYEYFFLDDHFDQQYRADDRLGSVFMLFTGLAIFISCLGLIGLSLLLILQRSKEIAVRKVLGASISGITLLLSKDFLKLVVIAALVAFPIAWWMLNQWLSNYAYRTTIQWWVFMVGGITALSIALLTVSLQSVRAAISNPVKSLRSE